MKLILLIWLATAATMAQAQLWLRGPNPVLSPSVGAVVNYGPADPTVLFDPLDAKWKMWYSTTLMDVATGARAMVIQYAESSDGSRWSTPQTALATDHDPSAWDHTNVETPSVIINPDPAAPAARRFLLYYSGANSPIGRVRYKIGLAYSADGLQFSRAGVVLSPSAGLFGALPGVYGGGVVADPSVLHVGGRFVMWLSSYAETADGSPLAYGISRVTSADGVAWSSDHPNPLPSLYKPGEPAGGAQPTVIYDARNRVFEMWFSNDAPADAASIPCMFNTVRGFWRATSVDGVRWTPNYAARDFIYSSAYPSERLGLLTGGAVVLKDGRRHLFYSSFGDAAIPDARFYYCPTPDGLFRPAMLSLNRARRR